MASAETMEQYSQTLWMHHFSIRLMQLHQGMHASFAMKLAAEAWDMAHERDPEDVARDLDEVWLDGRSVTAGGASGHLQAARPR